MKVYKLNTATKKKYYKESKFCQKNYEESKVCRWIYYRDITSS